MPRSSLLKQSFPPFLEVTNYNPLNNLKSTTGNYIYYKYTNTFIDSKTELTHKIIIDNVDPDVDINVLFVGGGGNGGSANRRSGGGAGGGGGEVLLSKFKLSNINDGVLKFKIGNIANQTQLYNTKPTPLYVANAGKKGGNGSSKKGDGGDSYNGLPKRNIDIFTSGLGSGVGGAGGGYTTNGKNGSTANLATGVTGAKIGSSIRDPYYITINLNDGTGNINTSYGGRGNQGQEDGYDGQPGYVLIYYIVNSNLQDGNDIDLGNNNMVTFGYNPLGKYLSSNYLNVMQEWCYIYLKDESTIRDINLVNNLIGNNPYNILAVGGGGGGGNYFYSNENPNTRSDFCGGGGGAGGAWEHKINYNPLSSINQIIVGKTGNSNRITNSYQVKSGENTVINYTDTSKNILANGGPGGYDCENHTIFKTRINEEYYTSMGVFTYNITETGKIINNSFFPAGGVARGLIRITRDNGNLGNNTRFELISGDKIDEIMKTPNKIYETWDSLYPVPIGSELNTIYEIYKGDIFFYGSKSTNLKTPYSLKYVRDTDIRFSSRDFINKLIPPENDIVVNYVGSLGKGYHQDKSPDGLMTRTEVNSNYDSTASPHRNGNIITYNFNNKILSDINTDTNIIISKGGNAGDLRYKRQGSGNDGKPGSDGFILIWFKRPFDILI